MKYYHDKTIENLLKELSSDASIGLTGEKYRESVNKYGINKLSEKKKEGFFTKLFRALNEPMMIILFVSFILAFGTELGKYFKTGEGDFLECIGILGAIILSVSITLIMEGSSKRAFELLGRVYDGLSVRVIRDGKIIVVDKDYVVKGDVILLDSGDKIIADGRLLESNDLYIDESALTGESKEVKKDAEITLPLNTPMAERTNCVYSGSFVKNGTGKMLVVDIGDNTEMGKIAGEIAGKKTGESPLEHKLKKLGKTITVIGAICAVFVFIVSILRLCLIGGINFDSVRELFISCIVLIVAAVPEGLPTIVAVSLALNMIKLSKENALVKKMVAAETMGAVSVICSDKTGTLTQNKMQIVAVIKNGRRLDDKIDGAILDNFILNNTADKILDKNKPKFIGSATECAILERALKSYKGDYVRYRENNKVEYRLPFSSDIKKMITVVKMGTTYRYLIKGAPEKILPLIKGEYKDISANEREILKHQSRAERVLCFAHFDSDELNPDKVNLKEYVFDCFVCITDPVRPEVKKAVEDCKRANIKVKMLTGDNLETAYSIARELKIASSENEVISAKEIEGLSDDELRKIIDRITVIARSTPTVKLRIVKILKSMGEVVAVTGDGTNDAPAIRHADIGIAMGISGSEITKETADMILLNDSFATVVKAISFGRNLYRNLQRFILFQLTVNLSALLLIVILTILGKPTPFNTFQLLWINVIMDGPPAITLGLEPLSDRLLSLKPVKRTDSIVSVKMLLRIVFNAVLISGIILAQYFTNFLGAKKEETGSVIFTLFILFQLFNAFNSRELGAESIFSRIGKNKVMVYTFLGVFACHVFIVEVCYKLFNISPLPLSLWLKCILVSSSIILLSETGKLIYRLFSGKVIKVKIKKPFFAGKYIGR